ncbi:type VI secretion system protein TssA [Mesoterricola silvestris]|uniref:ImpA N-terminal domain-containing protein n=1 Tax=Mesoterricola silvestris TaxID=2927979 RepID=A0AA48H0E2_9BACT|nr:type VI secretion system protein TssA [Mesoterricola silvestris]BDU73723.1 hypothetical protein METEAL_28970 [Mesoterricola silvestris]
MEPAGRAAPGSAPTVLEPPAGENLPDLPEFEALDAEIAKLGSVTGAGSLDWERVLQLATGLLARGWDLKVASAHCAALAQLRRQEGLALGLRLYRELLETHWETLTPPLARMRGRRNAVRWLLDRLEQTAPAWPPVAWPGPQRDALLGDLRAIDGFLAGHMDEAPAMRALIQQAGAWVEEAGEPGPAPAPPEAPPPAPAAPVAEALDLEQMRARCLEQLARVAARNLEEAPGDPVPYLLHRTALWLGIRHAPEAWEGRTRIPPPTAQATGALDAARATGNARLTLAKAEALLPDHLFWLDLNRWVAESLDGLGWGRAARAVEGETLLLLRLLPGLETLAFADGTPFADEATRQWLARLTRPDAKDGAQPDGILPEARRLAADGDLPAAAALLARGCRDGAPARVTFQRKTALCDLLTAGQKGRVAAAVARDLLGDLERFQVPSWDPSLALEALQIILAGLRAGGQPADEVLARAAFEHLALLDPGLAMGQP